MSQPLPNSRAELADWIWVLHLLEPGSPVERGLIEKFTNLPIESLSRLLRQLEEAGLVESQKGAFGLTKRGAQLLALLESAPEPTSEQSLADLSVSPIRFEATHPIAEVLDLIIPCVDDACPPSSDDALPLSSNERVFFSIAPVDAVSSLSVAPSERFASAASAEPSPEWRFGWLAENIPRTMRGYCPVEAEVRLSPELTASLFEGFIGPGTVELQSVPVSAAMSVRLTAPKGGFAVTSNSPETQWVDAEKLQQRVASWRFSITPTRRGKNVLCLTLSYRVISASGLMADALLPDRLIEIVVQTNVRRLSAQVAAWTFTLIAGAAAGVFIQSLHDHYYNAPITTLYNNHSRTNVPENGNLLAPRAH